MTQPTLLGFCIDQSGSMLSCTNETIVGVNQLFDEQRQVPGDLRVSLLLFSHTFSVPFAGRAIAEVPPMSATEGPNLYRPDGNTALLDAMGAMIDGLEAWAGRNQWAGQVKVVVFTDGQENASTRTTRDRLNARIAEKQAAGWEFIFLGSGGAAWLEGQSLSAVAATAYSVGVGGAAVGASLDAVSAGLTRARRHNAPVAAVLAERYGEADPGSVSPPPTPASAGATAGAQRRNRWRLRPQTAGGVAAPLGAPYDSAVSELAGRERYTATVDALS